jgi:hypothetical protein
VAAEGDTIMASDTNTDMGPDVEPGVDPAPTPPATPDGATSPKSPPRRHHVRRDVLIGGAAVLVIAGLVAGIGVGRYLLRDQPGAKSVDEAVEQYRSGTGSTDTGSSDFVRPVAGVYTVEGEGEERISTPPNAQNDGAQMPLSVTYLPDGCWTLRLDYNVAHWQEWDLCPRGDQLLLMGQRNYQAWDFGFMKVDNTGTFACDPPAPIVVGDPAPGSTAYHHCTGTNTASAGESTSQGPATVVGNEVLSIGGQDVVTIHQHRAQTMSGGQEGTVDEDWWYATDTGLPVRSERSYRIDSGSIIGPVTYTETGTWQLTSMEPRT